MEVVGRGSCAVWQWQGGEHVSCGCGIGRYVCEVWEWQRGTCVRWWSGMEGACGVAEVCE